jgi:hypothetical protein
VLALVGVWTALVLGRAWGETGFLGGEGTVAYPPTASTPTRRWPGRWLVRRHGEKEWRDSRVFLFGDSRVRLNDGVWAGLVSRPDCSWSASGWTN